MLQADKEKVLPNIENYKLQVSNLDNAPANSIVHAKVVNHSELMVSGTKSAHRELKKTMRQNQKPDSEKMSQRKKKNVPKQRPKRPANGFIVFATKKYAQLAKENPEKSMSELSKITGEQWKLLSDQERMQYKELGQSDFQQRKENWNRALELTQSNRDNQLDMNQSLAFTRMS